MANIGVLTWQAPPAALPTVPCCGRSQPASASMARSASLPPPDILHPTCILPRHLLSCWGPSASSAPPGLLPPPDTLHPASTPPLTHTTCCRPGVWLLRGSWHCTGQAPRPQPLGPRGVERPHLPHHPDGRWVLSVCRVCSCCANGCCSEWVFLCGCCAEHMPTFESLVAWRWLRQTARPGGSGLDCWVHPMGLHTIRRNQGAVFLITN